MRWFRRFVDSAAGSIIRWLFLGSLLLAALIDPSLESSEEIVVLEEYVDWVGKGKANSSAMKVDRNRSIAWEASYLTDLFPGEVVRAMSSLCIRRNESLVSEEFIKLFRRVAGEVVRE